MPNNNFRRVQNGVYEFGYSRDYPDYGYQRLGYIINLGGDWDIAAWHKGEDYQIAGQAKSLRQAKAMAALIIAATIAAKEDANAV